MEDLDEADKVEIKLNMAIAVEAGHCTSEISGNTCCRLNTG